MSDCEPARAYKSPSPARPEGPGLAAIPGHIASFKSFLSEKWYLNLHEFICGMRAPPARPFCWVQRCAADWSEAYCEREYPSHDDAISGQQTPHRRAPLIECRYFPLWL
jgi:hypothetical protein